MTLDRALRTAFNALTYPVSTEIDPRGYSLRIDRDEVRFAAETLADALASRPSAIVEEPMAVASERPIMQPPRISDEPEWAQVNALFRAHGLGDPPWRLRDELVGWLVWARYYRAALNAALTVEPEAGEVTRAAAFEECAKIADAFAREIEDTESSVDATILSAANVGATKTAKHIAKAIRSALAP